MIKKGLLVAKASPFTALHLQMQGQNKIERAATLDPELKHSVSCFLFNAVVQFLGTNTPTHLVTFMSTWRTIQFWTLSC